MKRCVPALVALLLAALPALADPSTPQAVADGLARGELSAAAATASWRSQGVDVAEALRLVAGLEPTGERSERFEVTDGFDRSSYVLVREPSQPLPDGRYGVIVVLHGLGGNASQLLGFVERVAPPGFLIAAPQAQRLELKQNNEDSGVLARALQHWWSYQPGSFPLRALAEVERRYPVDTNRVILMGYSMGGYGTWNIGLRYPDRFAAIVPMAGGLSVAENLMPRDERIRPLVNNGTMVPSWFTHGDRDGTVPVRFSRLMHEELGALGAEHAYVEVPGGGHILRPFLRGNEVTQQLQGWLAERVRDPHPRRVDHTVLGTYHGASYWLRIDAASRGGRAVAQVSDGNVIDVSTRGVQRLTVFLDPQLVDVDAPVTVRVNGVVVHQGRVAPSVQAVAESFADDRDPALSYGHAVQLDLAF